MQNKARTRSGAGRRPGALRGLLAAAVLAAPLVTGCAAESREDLLKAFALDLPACQTEILTFSGTTSWPDTRLATSFTVPKDCVDGYLKAHGVDLTNPVQWPALAPSRIGDRIIPPTEPPFEDETMEQFGLELDPSAKYDMFLGFTTPKKAEFLVLLVPQGDRTAVYLESGATGDVKHG
ncbi:hypothetical protein [Streptomyces sp. NPDC086023]|uniref:hypothetical protein n=1 Tax=Streptomyces sp. NPDC086023 TaxID=3365746 RepID=UPI0037D2A576